jgi:hypothetical protein
VGGGGGSFEECVFVNADWLDHLRFILLERFTFLLSTGLVLEF